MKKYRVNVNGTNYEIALELISEQEAAAANNASAAPTAPTAPAIPAPPAAPAAGEEKISAPMPGTILAVHVTPGQAVKSGDVLMILEAMKMENEIMSPKDGVIGTVAVAKGASVESGTLLCTIA
jgi:biotin carboxyl carrier protein